MSKIEIKKINITESKTDIIVNAANSALLQGGGVCGAIFRAAGAAELTRACNEIGHCDTGKAVVTPAFRLPAKYIIHAVGPRWRGGHEGEPDKLYEAYTNS
ncbi:MAG: macro domain-containing protein, partial [Eubacterium sp.]|nr:macro domain-containing protein [Eubacterium sp.]